MSNEDLIRTVDGMASVCAEAEALRGVLPDAEAELVTDALSAIRSGEFARIRATLKVLDTALIEARGIGIYMEPTRAHDVASISKQPPVDEVYLCPRRMCTRSWKPAGGREVPRCAVSGGLLLQKSI